MRIIVILIALCLLFFVPSQKILAQNKDISLLLITGGHDFDRNSFYEMLDTFQGVNYEELQHPHANAYFLTNNVKKFDVILFYDMVQKISKEEKAGIEKLVSEGIGLVFLHHSIVSYQDWDFYFHLLGGRYLEQGENKSNYKHDVHFNAEVLDGNHPVTKGLVDFQVYDEIYGNIMVGRDVHSLLETDHPLSMNPLAWSRIQDSSKIIYIQPGHGPEIFSLPSYRQLLHQSIDWVGKKD